MIIVSQDKMEIVNLENIETIWISPEYDEGIYSIKATADTDTSLGYYKSEERAKEVLQEIIAAYKNEGIKKIDTIMIDEKIVFEMPIE